MILCFLCVVSVHIFQPAQAISDYNFAAVGDFGCSSNTVSTVNNIAGKNPEIVFGLGDYSYQPTGTCFFNTIAPIDSITKITFGNHEDDDTEGFSGYITNFVLSQTYYSFNHQNTLILVLDTDRNSYSTGSDQYNFAVSDLQAASQAPDIDWIIVYFHKPIYTSPTSTSAESSFRSTYHPLFDQYGVDLVLQGHAHNYQRTYPLSYNPNSPSNPIVTSSSTTDYMDPPGAIFAIVGTGGVNFHALSGKASYVITQQDDFFGQLDIKIANNGAKLEGKYYRNSGQTDDSFSITKVIGNVPPTANPQNVVVTKNTQQSITLTATDPNNDPLTYSIVTPPAHGTLSPPGSGVAARTYTPTTGYEGPDSFTFKANDGTLDSNVATVSITVQNGQPVANDQTVTLNKNTQQSITLTATDPNNDPLTYSIVTPPAHGTLSGTAPNLTYNPALDYVGPDSFTFKANDGTLDSNVATVSITIGESPVANDQTVTLNKNTQQSITLTATDPNNDPLTYSIVTPPAHGTLSPPGSGVAARTYTPTTGYEGPDSFTFKANDGTLDSNVATVSITVQQASQGGSYHYTPSLALTGSNYQDTASSSSLQLNQFSVAAWFKTSTNFGSDAYIVNKGGVGSDSAGQNLNYGIWMTSTEQIKAGFETSSGADQFVTSVNTYSDGQWHYVVVTNDGSTLKLYVDGVQVATKSTSSATPESVGTKPVRVGANSRVTPPGNFFTGEVDEVRVWNDDLTAQQVSDAFAGNINTGNQVLYLPFGSNPSPVANDQTVTLNKNTQQSITLTATDPNNDPLTYSIVTPPAHGTLSGTAPNLTYNPALDYVGPDSFTFKANDGTLDSNVATVSITIGESPVANDQTVTLNKNTQQSITLTATDPNNDPLTYSIVTPPAHGTLSPPGSGVAARTYTPTTGYEGPDSFTFKANDGTLDSNVATVSITVQNGQPVANDQTVTLNKNTQQSITLTATDPNNDPLTYSIVTPPAHGTLSGTAPNLSFTSTTGYEGPDSFTFKANDGTLDSNVATVSI